MPAITLQINTRQPQALLKNLLAALEGRQDAIDTFLQGFEVVPELFRVDLKQRSATGAIDLRAFLEPTDFLRELVQAVGAGDVDALVVESRVHE